MGCGSDMDNKADRSSSHSTLRNRLDSGIDIGKGEIECGRFKVDMAINRYEFLEN